MPRRCCACHKRVELTAPDCKCGNLYCMQHRAAESHACSYDYAGAERARATVVLVKVVAPKVDPM